MTFSGVFWISNWIELVERCEAFRYHHLMGRVWGTNAACLAFHEAFGYEVVGIQRDIGYLHGRWEDVVVLQRVLGGVKCET